MWGTALKFDFIIGNPPYQEDVSQKISETNMQTPKRNVFHLFQTAADELANKGTVLIYPGGRWIQRFGKGMEEFGLRQINDPHLKKVSFYPDSNAVFNNVWIADGVTIVIKDMAKTSNTFSYEYIDRNYSYSAELDSPGDKIIPLNPRNNIILDKINLFASANNLNYLHSRILPRSLFGIESNFIEDHKNLAKRLSPHDNIDFRKYIKLLTNDKAGKAGRSTWYVIDKKFITSNQSYINEWQVVVSSANAGGQKRDRQIELIDNHSAFGRVRVALGSFKSKDEALNFLTYVESKIVRFLFLMTDEALSSLGKQVPDFGNYSLSNGLINFSLDIDSQLRRLFKLTQEEYDYICSTVENQRKSIKS